MFPQFLFFKFRKLLFKYEGGLKCEEGVESGFWPESDVVSEGLGALARPRSAAPRAPFRLDAYFMPSGKNRKHTICHPAALDVFGQSAGSIEGEFMKVLSCD